jgi:hypothetical protein
LLGEEAFQLEGREVPFEEEEIPERGLRAQDRLNLEALVHLLLGTDPLADGQFSQKPVLALAHRSPRTTEKGYRLA